MIKNYLPKANVIPNGDATKLLPLKSETRVSSIPSLLNISEVLHKKIK